MNGFTNGAPLHTGSTRREIVMPPDWWRMLRLGVVGIFALCIVAAGAAYGAFTPLTPLPAPRVVSHSQSYPGDGYLIANLLDGRPQSEYASDGKGTDTVVEMQFAQTVCVGAFRHVDRNDPATVAASELVFLDGEGRVMGTVPVTHVNKRGGETFLTLSTPISAQRVRWHVTKLGQADLRAVGGAEIAFFAAGDPETSCTRDRIETRISPLLRKDGVLGVQSTRITVHHAYAEPTDAVLRMEGEEPRSIQLKAGANTVEFNVAAVQAEKAVPVVLEVGGKAVAESQLKRKPVRPLTVYILPHSHTDIGFTEIQTAIEKKQVQNLVDGIAHAQRTAGYPEGARFVWNVEVPWAADLYMRRLNEKQRADFLDAVKKGQVVLNGMYLNELTGLCRPEELIRLFRYATRLSEQTGAVVDSAMISDVPGYTWGTVPAMAHAGIKYFSTAPNYFDRIGTILREWENKPFYWVGPDGKSKVLVWIPFWGYAMSHRYGEMSRQLVEDLCDGLEKRGYPYDIAHVRWSGHGDNAVPDPSICEFVKDWNAKYASPRFIISGTSEAFRALEQKYGDKLPVVRGDWTPYWEDGAGSSALETAMNRQSSDRLAQAETLFAMLNPKAYPAGLFEDAWNNVLLYSEHTWGAWCSVTQPERRETQEQWEIKKSYADQADRQSRSLLAKALRVDRAGSRTSSDVNVFNTLSWPRTELVVLSRELSAAGDRVTDAQGKPVPSQRLSSGEMVFLAKDVAPFSARRFSVSAGLAHAEAAATATGTLLENGIVRVRVDEKTGGIVELTAKGFDGNFADTSSGEALNDYLYLPGDDLKGLKRNGPVKVSVGEKGPLVASLIVESDAPGCKKLVRELRVVAGMDHVELINRVDKARLQVKSYMAKEGKESVNFAFPFNVPGGQMVLDIPLGMMRPEEDQMPSACKNWFTVGRWADVSNKDRGITWVTLDAPLVQVGGITANLLNSQTNPDVWRKKVDATQKLYCWAMNNHWGTNYRAYQEGPTTFRFILRPHGRPDPAEASRFATGFSQPLLAVRTDAGNAPAKPLLMIQPADVLVSSLKPSDDGKAWIVRLFGASGESRTVTLNWGERQPRAIFYSDTSERRGEQAGDRIGVPGNGMISLRVEFE
ncbi:MAG: glycoside hydrolase family 38 C-terminal domain-containing protein [Bacillota bacterium]